MHIQYQINQERMYNILKKTKDTPNEKHVSRTATIANGKLFALYTARTIMLIFAEYLFVMIMCVCIVPIAVTYIGGASGMMNSNSLQDMLILWLFPSLFMVGCLFVFSIYICRKIYYGMCKLFAKAIRKQKYLVKQKDI